MTILEKATAILSLALHGEHHLYHRIKDCGHYAEYNAFSGLATYDFDQLTRIVVGAHDYAVRVEICSSGPHLIKLRFHARSRRDGGHVYERHPTLEQAAANIRLSQWYSREFELSVKEPKSGQ